MSDNTNERPLEELLKHFTRSDLLEISRSAARAAHAVGEDGDTRPQSPDDYGGAKDPLVRTLAALALRDLRTIDKLSYRELGAMLGVSHSRVAELEKNLNGAFGERVEELEEKRAGSK